VNETIEAPDAPAPPEHAALLHDDDVHSFTERWADVQTSFLDQPRAAVDRAFDLLSEVVQSLEANFQATRLLLEREWEAGGQPSTEDLRRALLDYKSVFGRLLSA
jgi:hypothetical protein